jgi:ParB/RepB/Spo0J family partition protein
VSANTMTQRKAALLMAVQGVGRAAGKNQEAADQGLSRRIRLIAAAEIHPDAEQPRRTFDEEAIARLTETVRTFGILSPIVVSPQENGQGYKIVLGERRYRAARAAGLEEIPTITTGSLEPREKLELQLLENCGREDLHVVEEGRAYARLVELGESQREIALKVGRSEASVSRALAIATRLPPEWLDEIERRKDLQSPSKLYEIAQSEPAVRDELWAELRSGASRDAIGEKGRGDAGDRRSALDPKLKKQVEELLRKLRARYRSQVDGRRVNRRALVELALKRLLESWDETMAEAFLASVGDD